MADAATTSDQAHEGEETRRDFLLISTIAVGAVGAGFAAWPFVDSMNPSKDVLALASTELNLSAVDVGQAITAVWRGKPIYVRHRTAKEIDEAKDVKVATLKDPESDADRVQKPEWLVMIGICTHLGCLPKGQTSSEPKGEFNGWFCPCHGSHYDTSGRIRKGPAPTNLVVPPYKFVNDSSILIG